MLTLSPKLNRWQPLIRRDRGGVTSRTISGPSLTLDFTGGHYLALNYRDRQTPALYLYFAAGSYGQRTITA